MEVERLTVDFLASRPRKGYYSDGNGLVLQVTANGAMSWIFRYRDRESGRRREMGLGSARNCVSLQEARERAGECRRLLLAGKDPIQDRSEMLAIRALASDEERRRLAGRRMAKASKRTSLVGVWDRTFRRWLSLRKRVYAKHVKAFNERYLAKHRVLPWCSPSLLEAMRLAESFVAARRWVTLAEYKLPRRLDQNERRRDDRLELSDTYVRGMLARSMGCRAEEVPENLLQVKRAHLKIVRELNEVSR